MHSELLVLGAVWLVLFYLAWLVRISLRFHWALIAGMMLLTGLPGIVFAVAPFGLVMISGFFYAFERWDALRGIFTVPRWPRAQIHRGPGKRRPREFTEPMPWLRGPNSY